MFSSPITGAPCTDYLTSPTYTVSATSGPVQNSRSAVVTALGGTQANVGVHSVDGPFQIIYTWPNPFKTVGQLVAGLFGKVSVPKNKAVLTLKKNTSVSSEAADDTLIRIEVIVPVGSALFAPNEVAAAISCAAGVFYADADEIAKTMIAGVTPA